MPDYHNKKPPEGGGQQLLSRFANNASGRRHSSWRYVCRSRWPMLAHPGGFIVLLRKSIGLEYSLLHFQRRHRVVENLVRAILVHILHVNEELDPVFPRSKPRSQLLIIPRIVALGGV